jgi:hypothetical protein
MYNVESHLFLILNSQFRKSRYPLIIDETLCFIIQLEYLDMTLKKKKSCPIYLNWISSFSILKFFFLLKFFNWKMYYTYLKIVLPFNLWIILSILFRFFRIKLCSSYLCLWLFPCSYNVCIYTYHQLVDICNDIEFIRFETILCLFRFKENLNKRFWRHIFITIMWIIKKRTKFEWLQIDI